MNKPSPEKLRVWTEQISQSDRGAFDSLFYALYAPLVRFSHRYVGNKAVANDIVQDAFVIVWEKRREMDPQRSVKAYMYSIVRNKSLNYLRDHAAETVGLDSTENRRQTIPGAVNQEEESEELLELLQKWIKELPKRQKEAFELSRFEGLHHDEIAGVMDVSVHTVNNHIVSALSHLRDQYDAYQNEVSED